MQAMGSGTLYDFVQLGKIESSLDGFNVFPCNTSENRVDIRIHQLLPDRIHVRSRCHGRILKLSSKHEKWLAIDNELPRLLNLFEMRNGRGGAHVVEVVWQCVF